MAVSQPTEFQHLVNELGIDCTAAEFHGFLSGLVSGGIQDSSWQTLTYQFTNDGHAFSQIPLAKLTEFYQQLNESFDEANTLFSLWLPTEEDGFELAHRIAQWTNHFLLGLGLAQPKMEQESEDMAEAIADLEQIGRLGFEEEDDNEELLEAGEEVVEYLRVVTLFLHSHFAKPKMAASQQVH